jgi:hypothetical protein
VHLPCTLLRFRLAALPLGNFSSAIDSVLKNGGDGFHAADESHNEFCIASALLACQEPQVLALEYEPPLTGIAKTIDSRASTSDGFTFFVDVKASKPRRLNRCDQFEKASREEWFRAAVETVLDDKLPETYDRALFTAKSNSVFETMLNYASQGVKWPAAA